MEGDRTRLQQVVANLIDNAIKYTQDCGTVEVSVHRESGNIAVLRSLRQRPWHPGPRRSLTYSIASIASTRRVRGPPAELGWDCPLQRRSAPLMARRSAFPARKGVAVVSVLSSPWFPQSRTVTLPSSEKYLSEPIRTPTCVEPFCKRDIAATIAEISQLRDTTRFALEDSGALLERPEDEQADQDNDAQNQYKQRQFLDF